MITHLFTKTKRKIRCLYILISKQIRYVIA
jgi:hypothetical protein